MAKFTIGADPEVFLYRDGVPISANGIIPGTKESPYPVKGGAVQLDGLAAEFNITPTPIQDFKSFNVNIDTVMRQIELRAAKAGAEIQIVPSTLFDMDYLAAQDPDTLILGCDPDYCAYTGKPNPRPDGSSGLRTAAGHIHIGWGSGIPVDHPDHIQICCDFVKLLDCTVGLAMTVLDSDPLRREMYGKAGAFRPKPYGVEYRTPSNVWLKTNETRRVIHTLANRAVEYASRGHSIKTLYYISNEALQDIINEGRSKMAKERLCAVLPSKDISALEEAIDSLKDAK